MRQGVEVELRRPDGDDHLVRDDHAGAHLLAVLTCDVDDDDPVPAVEVVEGAADVAELLDAGDGGREASRFAVGVPASGGALHVGVDEDHVTPLSGVLSREVGRDRRLPCAALLAAD